MKLAELLAAGPMSDGSGELWEEAAGRTARAACNQIALSADAGGSIDARDYAALLSNVLAGGEVRNRDAGHPQVLIWGTLEARVQTADLTILAGMNEGVWPSAPAPDPWLNRRMRKAAGLLLPERRIGLSAHDFVQAVAGKDVWITRSLRNEGADTVPSRWINRLTNLLGGLKDAGGDVFLAEMRHRATPWITAAEALSEVGEPQPAARPSPRPPLKARPTELSVTNIGTLIRDPYAIYAEKVLNLRKLDPLTPEPDARLKGTVVHKIFETFLRSGTTPADPDARDKLISTAQHVLEKECPWPTLRQLWLAQIERVADWFLETEVERQARGKPGLFEVQGRASSASPPFTLKAKADRIDIAPDGGALIYDYKTGNPPTPDQQGAFEKQLLLEAAMIERGAFDEVSSRQVVDAEFIGVGASPKIVKAPLETEPPEKVWAELCELMAKWRNPERGYTARMAPERITYDGDYDHLSRRGEWDDTDTHLPEDLS
jgi:double-strand break repair protein AddB